MIFSVIASLLIRGQQKSENAINFAYSGHDHDSAVIEISR